MNYGKLTQLGKITYLLDSCNKPFIVSNYDDTRKCK